MIAHLTGKLLLKSPDHCVIETGGVGYLVSISLSTFETMPGADEMTALHIHTHVREDHIALYGFKTLEEKTVFQKLISVSGVGPKTGLGILSGLEANELALAIANKDTDKLTAIPGIGKKTAERIVMELKDKIGLGLTIQSKGMARPQTQLTDEAISALINLGYQKTVAENALKKIELSDSMPIEAVIKKALKELMRA